MEIILASTNSHKIRELRDMFKSIPHLELLTLHQFPDYEPPEETGKTIRENATLKAEHAASYLNRWVLADDSGLFIPALSGLLGVHSARYAGSTATDKERCDQLLHEMAGYQSSEERTAHCVCCLALANPSGLQKCVEGICEGYIAREPRGRNGSGYDPIFIKNDYEKTFGELDDPIRIRISHRRKAFERLVAFLENLRD